MFEVLKDCTKEDIVHLSCVRSHGRTAAVPTTEDERKISEPPDYPSDIPTAIVGILQWENDPKTKPYLFLAVCTQEIGSGEGIQDMYR